MKVILVCWKSKLIDENEEAIKRVWGNVKVNFINTMQTKLQKLYTTYSEYKQVFDEI
jgi:hypothetical protein